MNYSIDPDCTGVTTMDEKLGVVQKAAQGDAAAILIEVYYMYRTTTYALRSNNSGASGQTLRRTSPLANQHYYNS